MLVATQGWLLKVVVAAAGVQDRDGGRLVAHALRLFGPTLSRLARVWADAASSGPLVEELREPCGGEVEIVKRSDDPSGFQVHPHRWIVERTFAWWQGFRRLAKDDEYQLESSEALISVAMCQVMTRRLARSPVAPPG